MERENIKLNLFSMEDLSWAAGFIDGEGCIGMYRAEGPDRMNQFRVVLQATNCALAPLEKLKGMFGGTIYVNHIATDRRRTTYSWRVSQRQLGKTLQVLLPYFVVKYEQAALALSARELVINGGKRPLSTIAKLDALHAQFRALNKRGI